MQRYISYQQLSSDLKYSLSISLLKETLFLLAALNFLYYHDVKSFNEELIKFEPNIFRRFYSNFN